MTIPQDTLDRLVRGYLDAVARNLVGVPEDRRRELLADLADHIAAERATLDDPTEADIRSILDRLGDPVAVAAEARVQEGTPGWTPQRPVPPPFPVPPVGAPRPGLSTASWVVIAVLATLAAIVLVICVGVLGFRTAHEGKPTPERVDVAPTQSGP